ncbi:MAG: N-6 DNA methylase [Vicinamibacterales bacterium]|nr:N-6 DNA methylase [Vicinamibacterales bacterium]
MLPGIHGSLVSTDYLESVLLHAAPDGASMDAAVRLTRIVREAHRRLGPASGARAVLELLARPLVEALGFATGTATAHGSMGFAALLHAGPTPAALLIAAPWGQPIEPLWRHAVRAGLTRRVRWCLATNGAALHAFDAGAAWTRRALDIDLAAVTSDPRAARALTRLVAAGVLAPEAVTGRTALDLLAAGSDAHGVSVCRSLRGGVIEALGHLVEGLAHGRVHAGAGPRFDQSLTLVYRILFLLFAESRGLVPVWHRVYRDRYTVDALARRAALRPEGPGHWDALRAISRMAHAGCEAGDLRVTAFNGRLFAPARTPLAEAAGVPDRAVAHAVTALTTTAAGPAGRQRIAYRDLGVEQLGAVYEHVLEYEPSPAGAQAPLCRTSDDRKQTGSFYTPRAMTDFLVRRTLAPLVEGRGATEILGLRIVDPAMGSGAFLVSACRYLAAAVIAARHAREGTPAEPDRDTVAATRRLVAQRCLYGVDLNPTAVQLARLSLWLATLAADRPLTFLDHHLATGDSLVGARFVDLTRVAPGARAARPRPLPLFDDETAAPLARAVLPDRYRLAMDPDESARTVRQKERALDRLGAPGTPLAAWRQVADVWCAGWFVDPVPDTRLFTDLQAAAMGGARVLPARVAAPWFARAGEAARRHRFFHWEIEFPEVFFGPDGRRRTDGGFDAVLGNPPWDMVRADSGDAGARGRDRAHVTRYLRFLRDAGPYRSAGGGHANRYQFFVERALQLVRPGGRLGLLVPAGLLLDHGSAGLRRRLLDETALERVTGFDNRDAIFPIHRSVRFLLVSTTAGPPTTEVRARFGLRSPSALDVLPDHASDDPAEAYPLALTRDVINTLDPHDLAIPDLASPEDLSLLLHLAHAAPALGDPAGWHAQFGRELNATDDRAHFRPRTTVRPARLLPIVEGKLVAPFRVDVDRAAAGLPHDAARQLLDRDRTWGRARIAYRDVASATNRLTLIAARLPAGTVSTHTLFCLKTLLDDDDQWCLLALMNSFVANYVARLYVTTHVTTAIVKRLPVPRPVPGSRTHRALVRLAKALARDGIDRRLATYVALQARVAGLYGLSRAQFAHVVSTFPLVDPGVRQAAVDAFAGNSSADSADYADLRR